MTRADVAGVVTTSVGREITALQREVLALVQALQIHEHGELGLLQPGIAEPLDERH